MPPELRADSSGEVPSQTPLQEGFLFDGRKIKLKNWLVSKSPFLGGLYEGAVQILYRDPPMPGWQHFVPHAIREIRNRLPNCLAGTESVGRMNYDSEIKKISEIWIEKGVPFATLPEGGEISDSTDEAAVSLPKEIFDRVSRLAKDASDVRSRKYRSAYRLFKAMVPEGDFGDNEPVIEQWIEVTDWFADSSRTHVQGEGQDVGDRTEYVQKFEAVEHILLGLIDSSLDYSRLPAELNEILDRANS